MMRLLAVLSVVVAVGTGCSSSEHEGQGDSDETTTDGAPTLVTYVDNGMHMEAAFYDVLAVNKAGCFALSDGSTIMLPSTWSVSPDGGGVRGVDGTELRIGDSFTAGGGFGGPSNRQNLTDAQRSCPSDGPPYANGGKYTSFAALWDIKPD